MLGIALLHLFFFASCLYLCIDSTFLRNLLNVQIPEHEPRFDLLVNDEWSKRHMVIQKFVQAGRKV